MAIQESDRPRRLRGLRKAAIPLLALSPVAATAACGVHVDNKVHSIKEPQEGYPCVQVETSRQLASLINVTRIGEKIYSITVKSEPNNPHLAATLKIGTTSMERTDTNSTAHTAKFVEEGQGGVPPTDTTTVTFEDSGASCIANLTNNATNGSSTPPLSALESSTNRMVLAEGGSWLPTALPNFGTIFESTQKDFVLAA